ncbi:hypothetical protein Salat_2519300 [Sesamum alatum]|uniref:Uncharacterized protein n=1 Tax=Sesamum alatum TaxID=300844 RepID=A0AAE1XSU9_9LAMI|nr:hypothetical protein Salat_2519300 [Sesamum alatum]
MASSRVAAEDDRSAGCDKLCLKAINRQPRAVEAHNGGGRFMVQSARQLLDLGTKRRDNCAVHGNANGGESNAKDESVAVKAAMANDSGGPCSSGDGSRRSGCGA